MFFNSWLFFLFFAVVFASYWMLRHRAQNILLLIASYVFYGAWDWRFLSLIWISTIVDYVAGLRIHASENDRTRRAWMLLSVFTNLGLLGVFKYYDFFVTEFVSLLTSIGVQANKPLLKIALPVGISFYTFQTMSYTIDVHRRRCEPTRDLLNFALYVCFFPQLVAGPIERFNRLMPQIEGERTFGPEKFQEGLYHLMIGLFKKVVVADNMATYVDAVFNAPTSELTGAECLVGVWAFALQIYGDFSGYSSIAQGVSRWLGFDLMYNFRMPYFASTPSEFWRRWHISLSQWLRDYLYIPLGGNRGGSFFTVRNLGITMLLGGLWHGAGWTFVVWGLYHGLILGIYRPFEAKKGDEEPPVSPLRRWLAVVLFFQVICVSWLLFRATSIVQAYEMFFLILTDASWTSFAVMGLGWLTFFGGPLLLFELWVERRRDMTALIKVHWLPRAIVYSYFAIFLWYFYPPVRHVFIYFQF